MIDQIRSEYRKVRTTRTFWGLLLGMLALVGLVSWGTLADQGANLSRPIEDFDLFMALTGIIPIFVLVLGVRSYTDEARHGAIVPTLLATPVRTRVVAAKLVVMAAAAIVFALAAMAFGSTFAAVWVAVKGVSLTVGTGAMAELVGKMVLMSVVWSAFAVGLGLIVHHQVAAIVGTLVWFFIVENLIGALAPDVAKFLPSHASTAFVGVITGEQLTEPAVGAVLFVAWALLSVGIGTQRFARRDV